MAKNSSDQDLVSPKQGYTFNVTIWTKTAGIKVCVQTSIGMKSREKEAGFSAVSRKSATDQDFTSPLQG
nr:hypothetical protein [Larkinella sp. C7]